MIKSLFIKNYALIQELEMNLDRRLNIITGETGAGKSIMLGAVGLLLGSRADSKILLNENEECVVEGIFDISGYHLEPAFEKEGLNYRKESVIRREIRPVGKSRSFVNDTPTTLAVLKVIGECLMDIHSQHESLQLGNNHYQLEVLDAFASHTELIVDYQAKFQLYVQAKQQLEKLEQTVAKSVEEADYKQFLFNELLEANLNSLNKNDLENGLEVLENAENIKRKLSQSVGILDESEIAIMQQLTEVRSLLNSIANFSKDLGEANERIESVTIEVQDLSNELLQIQEKIEYNPEKIYQIKDQLDMIYRLEKKHNVSTVEELIAIRDELDKGLQTSAHLDQEIAEAKKALEVASDAMQSSGNKLTESRKLSVFNFADEIEKIIHKIGIENGVIEIKVAPSAPTQYGLDTIDMLFSANKGVKPRELKEVASGGEFSRLIFAIKYLIADKTAFPTIVFDEIDTGISGEVAIQMVRMMKEMAQNHQVISISHLPQFAAGGNTHYFVYKDHGPHRSVSKIKKLQQQERIIEIAKMIGGGNPGNSAIESAKELLQIG